VADIQAITMEVIATLEHAATFEDERVDHSCLRPLSRHFRAARGLRAVAFLAILTDPGITGLMPSSRSDLRNGLPS
jgi:hypothetical protein